MRFKRVLIAGVMALAVCLCFTFRKEIGRSPRKMMGDQSPPTIEKIQALAQLVIERVNVSDVIQSHLVGRTGSMTATVFVRGSVLVGTDLSRAHFESIDDASRSVVLILPRPTVLQVSVDHDQTHVLIIFETGLWRITPGNDATSAAAVDQAYRDAQQFVADAGKESALVVNSRRHAEKVLSEFFRMDRWKVIFRWAE